MYEFTTAEQLLKLCNKHNVRISEIAIRFEMEFSAHKRSEVLLHMRKIKKIMKEAVRKGLRMRRKTVFGMSGGNARKLINAARHKKMMMPPVVLKAMAYATATGETNAAMGRITAFPTAGGAGVIPGVLLSVAELNEVSEQKLLKGLFTASAIGKIIAENATLSAAAGGCQAEIGAAVSMAAAGLTEMRGGTPEQCLNAASLALKSYLGLACDPIGGLVAVPCIKRNTLGASMAFAASDTTMAGIESFVPFDEVVFAMKNIAKNMSYKLRETALGGLAITPTGLKIRKKIGLKDLKDSELK